MNEENRFLQERSERIESYGLNSDLNGMSSRWIELSMKEKYVYNFDWLGRPIIQYPQDVFAMQELIWEIKPDLIIETGIAHGGSLIFSASMLALLDMGDAIANGTMLDPKVSARKVLGIDIDIRKHNRSAIEAHPMASRIQMIEGSSVDTVVVDEVKSIAKNFDRVLVCLDSNHTYDHVLSELEAYAPLVSIDSYCVVFDTFVDDMPEDVFPDRPWGPNNNPKIAAKEFLSKNSQFTIDKDLHAKLQISVAHDGFLKRISL